MTETNKYEIGSIIITEYITEKNKSYAIKYKNDTKKNFKCSRNAYLSESEKIIYDEDDYNVRIFDILSRRSKNYPPSSEIIVLDRYLYIAYGNNIMIIRRCDAKIVLDGIGYTNLGRCDELFVYYTFKNGILLVYKFSEKDKFKSIFKAIEVVDCDFELNYENLIVYVDYGDQSAKYDVDLCSGICERIE